MIDSEDKRFKVLDITMKQNHYRSDILFEILYQAQEAFGYLEQDTLSYIAQRLELPLSHVYGVATFSNLFDFKPVGVHVCSVCRGTTCHLKGGSALLETLDREMNLHPGETTSDGQVALRTERCMGACNRAPVIMFDGKVSGQQTPETLLEIVKLRSCPKIREGYSHLQNEALVSSQQLEAENGNKSQLNLLISSAAE